MEALVLHVLWLDTLEFAKAGSGLSRKALSKQKLAAAAQVWLDY